ncbi:unnamed protein product [Phytophthora fragariaefolia]|uniref:Unnamed protein product n=1 Tax=Phytophthora fragariaefolia TaxID=1490495 RepID=A0A9W6XKQ7_9STRA|nr:unnamed protein product [Phytophthora fragariaefolia]
MARSDTTCRHPPEAVQLSSPSRWHLISSSSWQFMSRRSRSARRMGNAAPKLHSNCSDLMNSDLGLTCGFSWRSTRPNMPKDRFVDANPYPAVHVSEEERRQLVELVDGFVQDYFRKYEEFVVVSNRKVDERRWDHVKSRNNIHIYTERSQKDLKRNGVIPAEDPRSESPENADDPEKELPVMLSVGTFVGEMDDLMFGVVNPTLDVMRIKASYVHDLDSAAVLCPVVEPTEEEPFQSLVVKWMTIDVPLQSTNIVKCRDFVYIEATGILQFANGDRVGYHLLHSIDFPLTKPLPNKIRGNLSVFGFFRQIEPNVIDNFASGIVDPGGEIMRFLLIPTAAEALLSATNYVYCGQMKKISWMLQRRHSAFARQDQTHTKQECIACGKKTTHGKLRGIGRSTCRLCYGRVCFPCKVRKRISFIALDGRLLQRKITFCAKCVIIATKCDAQEAARDQAMGYEAYKALSSSSQSSTIESSMFD